MKIEIKCLFASHPMYSAREIFEFPKARDIYVRWLNKPRIDNYLRITVGTDTDMPISALKEVMKIWN